MIHENRHLVEFAAWLCAGITAISLAQLAFVATALAGFSTFILAMIRVHDRWKYGPGRRGE